ncbi:PilN domain-containing protein [Methylomonas sp. AM2-LC]|uniref:PilN domain-containing protein n=1 Tax=Methylomonas sp. AM2-LC TaxID=3153301 RepID=UPI00326618B9
MNLQSTIDLDIKGFYRWWLKELAFLVPKKVKQLISDRTGSLIFTAGNDGFTVCFLREDNPQHKVFEVKIEDNAAYQNLLNQYADIDKADFILRLSDAQAMAKFVYLPEAAQENLQQVVGFELDRYTPFKREQVYYTAVSLGKTGFGQIQVLLVLTPQAILDDLLAQLNSWGVQPGRIEFASIQSTYPQTEGVYNLLPERYQPSSNPFEKSIHWLLNGVMLILLIAVMVYPVWQEQQAVDYLKAQIKALEKDTRLVDQQQLEIDAQRDETQKLISIKTQTPELVPVLNELTHLLKNDTWLSNLQYSEKHMQITGQSPSASSLIGVLEASPYFSKVSFVSPLTQDKVTGFERFQISMDVSSGVEANAAPTSSGAAGNESSKSFSLPEDQP